MNESSPKIGRYAVVGILFLCLLAVLAWFALRPEPPPPNLQPAKVEALKPVAPVLEPADDLASETPTNQPNDSTITNAADLYRQAFALYDALTNDEKAILGDWQTNVDVSVEAKLCEKIRPICDLMHQASAVTNCDWGIGPINLETEMPHLGRARNIARSVIWSAAHCRSNDVAGAADDALSILRLGHDVSQTLETGCLMDMALQSLASSYIALNIALFSDAENERLLAAFSNPAYEEAPSRAMEQAADMAKRLAAKVATMPELELKKELSELESFTPPNAPELNQASTLVALKQIANSDRELAKALASSSEDDYEAWLQHWTELKTSNPLANAFLGSDDYFVDHVQAAEVNRALVVAGLAVAQGGADALPSYPDPSSGQPFTYTETADGFELQSSYQVNGKPMTMRFK